MRDPLPKLTERHSLKLWMRERSGSLGWSTQFNDLRQADSFNTKSEPKFSTVLREMKRQALFEHCTVVRDADVINNEILLEILLNDQLTDAMLSVENGFHVLALRESHGSFSALHDDVKESRADPSCYEALKERILILDKHLAKGGTPIADVPWLPSGDTFRETLERLLTSKLLDNQDEDILSCILKKHQPVNGKDLLKFGEIYNIVKQREEERTRRETPKPNSDVSERFTLMQWLRAAHVLTIPRQLDIPPSSSNTDLHPDQISFVLGQKQPLPLDASAFLSHFPINILSRSDIDRMSFREIVQARKLGEQIGYFRSIKMLHETFFGPPRDKAFQDKRFLAYLEALVQYIEAMGKDLSLELEPWQHKLATKANDRMSKREDLAVLLGIPIIVEGIKLAHAVTSHSPIPITFAEVGEFAKYLGFAGVVRASREIFPPRKLKRLIEGTTITPRNHQIPTDAS